VREAKPGYPWRLGATSFVLPGEIAANVEVLGPLVDDVQLLFFESAERAGLAQPLDLLFLRRCAREHRLSYTVHLPLDIRLGHPDRKERQRGRAEVLRLMEELAPLAPRCFDLHLVRETAIPPEQWLENLASSLAELAGDLGTARTLLAVENIDAPLALLAPLALAHGFSLCLDLGHLLRYGHGLAEVPALLPRAAHLHWHGLRQGKDHQAIADREQAAQLGEWLAAAAFAGVVTLEMYSLGKLTASLALLEEAWAQHRSP
jgi:sugar phosphate isomerase/epimerase